jgi:hypothetical protein
MFGIGRDVLTISAETVLLFQHMLIFSPFRGRREKERECGTHRVAPNNYYIPMTSYAAREKGHAT